MKRGLFTLFVFLLLAGTNSSLSAQATFAMQDTVVEVCKGIFTDSDGAATSTNYDHNEDYTFTICPPGGVQSITLNFTSFCTEANFDILRIFAGADTFATLVGTYSGTTLPPPITVTTCMTIHFKSDPSLACTGWMASWSAIMVDPVPPLMTIVPSSPTCSTAALTANFSYPIQCDSINTGIWTVTGPLGQTVSASPQGCTPTDSSSQVNLILSPGLDNGGAYIIDFAFQLRDACDSLWVMEASDTISINDCPIAVTIYTAANPVCPGECTTIWAVATGGDSTTYNYAWSNGLPNGPGPFTVCPTTTTTYTCTVSDAGPAAAATGTYTLNVLPPPSTQVNTTVCQSDPAFNLSANPTGGIWNGPGIQDSLLGTFHPDSAGPGAQTVFYTGPNGCTDSVIVTVTPIDAGTTEAACPGAAPFNVSGFSPAGGTWSGPNITSGGQFNPASAGSYTVTYTAGGCSDTKVINVQNLNLPPDDTTCQSTAPYNLTFSPFGGSWSGPGITNAATGRFNPAGAGVGNHTLTYTLNGCSGTVDINVAQISAGNNQVACPKQSPFTVFAGTPAGGVWSGTGILDSLTGLFNPGVNSNNWTATLTYTFGGCSDDKFVYVRHTQIMVDTLQFCRQDTNDFFLNYANTGRNVGNGNWTGPGVTDPNYPGTLNPALAGPGFHTLNYSANTCSDSMTVLILPPKQLTDTIVCELTPAFGLSEFPADPAPGGLWSGTGVTDANGIFDPGTSGPGTFPIYYTSLFGCPDTSQIEVTAKDSVWFTGLPSFYCYVDTQINLSGQPFGGSFFGPGMTDSVFNPATAGPGAHQISYTYGSGDCQETVNQVVIVGQPLFLTASMTADSICIGDYTTLNAGAAGGTGSGYTFAWNQGLPSSFQHLVNPSVTTNYIVTVSDGCTDPVSDTLEIYVQQPFSLIFDSSTVQCAGNNGWVSVASSIPGNFIYEWQTSPLTYGDTLFAPVGSDYIVEVRNQGTDCIVRDTARIPGYSPILASFSSNPSACALITDPEIEFIDLSVGFVNGTWDFGDGTNMPWIDSLNPSHTYPAIGTYLVSLWGENEGQCTDSISIEICIEPEPFHVYNTFSPNGDGVNDFFEIDGLEAFPDHRLSVYNRYGQLVFQTDAYQNNWNGRHFRTDALLPDGAYFYVIELRDPEKEDVAGDVVIFR